MLHIDILTIHPGLMEGPFSHSIVKRAVEKKLVQIQLIDLRDFCTDKHRTIDDYPFGGGAGMVMKIEPIKKAIDHLSSQKKYDEIIYMSPDGELLDQPLANQFSLSKNLLILCGHYKGIDERVRTHFITKEISIGNYVLSGGELAAAVFCDAIIRLIPGVIGDETSALSDSFQDQLLAPPVYTRPADFEGLKVPDVLLSGDEKKISEWRHEQSVKRTKERRPGLFD
ncbi:MAG TPA: tRNA (guanosine(37)-N1)-methyltransferase TrmD [Bacteroidia bacterium]|nr:tRNA (guanosine(37)-N1)-methyltransferase TrmD [Bacteroidia bacterium]HNT80552.1 tRNA (guanosine(37)-N1)-methyltransferase TrmD [Bacteroidia bacterium]